MSRRPGITVGALAISALALAACDWVGSQTTEERSYQVTDQVTTLVVNAEAGRVEIITGPGPVVVSETLHYGTRRPEPSHTVAGGTLTLREGCRGHFHRCSVDYQVRVPDAVDVRVTANAGRVSVTGLAGDLDVDADAGRITGTDLASQHTRVHASAGAIELTYRSVPAMVRARSDAGRVEVAVPGGTSYRVDASTDAGHRKVTVPIDSGSPYQITVHSDAGSVDVHTT